MKRKIKIAVISDVHLGTYGCQAKELLHYLKSISPEVLVLNGDIVDIWQFSKKYWPKAHMQVVKQLMEMVTLGSQVYYITGNHDELLRKFVGFELDNFKIVNKLVLELDGQKAWFFHGDVFDTSISTAKWLAKLGGKGYDLLIFLNHLINRISEKLGRGKVSLSKKVKERVKSAVNHMTQWEQTVADMGEFHGFDQVICGHIHRPVIKNLQGKKGKTLTYLNSGDWVENCTSLEYAEGKWRLVEYFSDVRPELAPLSAEDLEEATTEALFRELVAEFQLAELTRSSS